MTTQNERKKREQLEAQLRDALSDKLQSDLVTNPEMSVVIDNIITKVLNEDTATVASITTVDGTGLVELIGLSGEAPKDLGSVSIAGKVENYDEDVNLERLLAVADLYYAMHMELLGVFRCVHKLQELFRAGTVPLSDGDGAFGLYRFDKQKVLRYRLKERLEVYNRLFGLGAKPLAPGAKPNTAFNTYLTMLVTQTVAFYESKRVSSVISSKNALGQSASFSSVRRAALDARENIKGASYGNITVMRSEVMQLLDEAFRILGAKDVLKLFGSENAWEVVEEISRRYFNKNNLNISQRNRLATAGANILSAIANKWVTSSSRATFEVGLQEIELDAEDWLISATALGIATEVKPRIIRGKTRRR